MLLFHFTIITTLLHLISAQLCPPPFTGTRPNCIGPGYLSPCKCGEKLEDNICVLDPKNPCKKCPPNYTGPPGVCKYITDDEPQQYCPERTTGTYPNCNCIRGYTGKSPNCKKICPCGYRSENSFCIPDEKYNPCKCPPGLIGKYPRCTIPTPCPCGKKRNDDFICVDDPDAEACCPPGYERKRGFSNVCSYIDGSIIETENHCPLGFEGIFPICIQIKVDFSSSVTVYIYNRCPVGFTGELPRCISTEQSQNVEHFVCPENSVGDPPNCICATGYYGTGSNCKKNSCPCGHRFEEPNCILDSSSNPCPICPEGFIGTPPNCAKTIPCPIGYNGQYPNCIKIVCPCDHKLIENDCVYDNTVNSCSCPTGSYGKPPSCYCLPDEPRLYPYCNHDSPPKCPPKTIGKPPFCRCENNNATPPECFEVSNKDVHSYEF